MKVTHQTWLVLNCSSNDSDLLVCSWQEAEGQSQSDSLDGYPGAVCTMMDQFFLGQAVGWGAHKNFVTKVKQKFTDNPYFHSSFFNHQDEVYHSKKTITVYSQVNDFWLFQSHNLWQPFHAWKWYTLVQQKIMKPKLPTDYCILRSFNSDVVTRHLGYIQYLIEELTIDIVFNGNVLL